MCDCKQDKDIDDISDMVTLFKTCPKPYQSGKSMVNEIIANIEREKCDWKPREFVKPEASESSDFQVCDAQKDTCSDSGSTLGTDRECQRTYKFRGETECLCVEEQEGEKDTSIITPPVSKASYEDRQRMKKEKEQAEIECTLAIIKPEALMYRKEIEGRIFEEGFVIYQTRWIQLTPEQASEFYFRTYGQMCFPHLVAYMSSSPILVHVLAKQNAVADWRLIIGPTKVVEARLYFPDSIRGTYGRRGEDFKNAVHGSASLEDAEKEIHFFFPNMILEPITQGNTAVDYVEELVNPILVKALALCCRLKPPDPVTWLANWLLANNPNKPTYPEKLAIIPS